MKIVSCPALLLLAACGSGSAEVIGSPYLDKRVLSSPFCQHVRCQPARTARVGDKFSPTSAQATIFTYSLKPRELGLSLAELSARVTPDQKLDLMKLSFTVTKKSGVKAAAPLVAQWLNLLGLPKESASACLTRLGGETFVSLSHLPKTLEGGCTAHEDRPGFLNVIFSVGRVTQD